MFSEESPLTRKYSLPGLSKARQKPEVFDLELANLLLSSKKVASNLTNSFIAAGKALSQESLVEVGHLSEDESEPTSIHEASFDELETRRASLIGTDSLLAQISFKWLIAKLKLMMNSMIDISSQVLLAATVSEQANEAFLIDQPNFLPDNDAELINSLVESKLSKTEASQDDQVNVDPDTNKQPSVEEEPSEEVTAEKGGKQESITHDDNELIEPFGRKIDTENTEIEGTA